MGAGKGANEPFVNALPLNPPLRNMNIGRLQHPVQAQNRPDLSKSQMSDVTIKVKKEEVQFETPKNLNDRVQDLSETKRIEKLEKDVDFKKKQVYKKYKNRNEYKNQDAIDITSKQQFRDAQIQLVQDSNTYVSKAVHISKDHDPRDCYLFIDDESRQAVQVNPNDNSLNYVSTCTFSEADYVRDTHQKRLDWY